MEKNRLLAVLATLSEGLVIRDLAGKVIQANAAAEQILGGVPAEMQGWENRLLREDGSLLPPGEQPFARTSKTGQSSRGVVLGIRRDDDEIRWLLVNTEPVRDPAGKMVAVVTSFAEMPEKVEADRGMRDSEALLRTLVQHAPAAVAMFDRQMRYLVASRQWYSDYHLENRDVTGRSHYEVFPEIPDRWKRDHEQAMAGRVIRSDADLFTRADGSAQWLSYEIRPWHYDDGQVGGIVMFTRDITRQKTEEDERARFEQKMMEAQKLESLGVLAGGIAHDFNNLLTGIMGNNSLALALLPPDSPAGELLKSVQGAAQRAADLARQMLAYSGRGKFVVQRLDLSEVVEETSHLVDAMISKKVQVHFDLVRHLPPVEIDSSQIRQVVMNLVINAAEAMEDREGEVRIRTFARKVEPGEEAQAETVVAAAPGEYVCLEISDTGCGIREENLRRIFDPFFTTKFAGRGLGLAAVLGIVRGHKGGLAVASQPGRGTSFTMLLPSSNGPCNNLGPQTSADVPWVGQGTVLVIEDEETVRTTVERILNVLGFSVVLTADGREGLDTFLERPGQFDLVLLDLTMPCLDGAQVFSQIRRHDSRVPVLLMSGFGEQEATERFAGQDLNGFVQKPFDIRALERAVKAALAQGE